MKTLVIGIFFLVVAADMARAAPSGSDRYRDCLQLADRNPAQALGVAESWQRTDGGIPAQHCVSLALVGLGRYAEAAARLDALAREKGVTEISLRAQLLDQAGNAWMLGGDGAKAQQSFTAALALNAGDPDLFADLARAKAMQKNWASAEADLNAALALSPGRADLLVLRASALDAQGKPREAFADLDRVLLAHPGDADALVERGTVKLEAGDKDGARKDWLAALAAEPNGEAATAARDHLSALGQPVKPVPK